MKKNCIFIIFILREQLLILFVTCDAHVVVVGGGGRRSWGRNSLGNITHRVEGEWGGERRDTKFSYCIMFMYSFWDLEMYFKYTYISYGYYT